MSFITSALASSPAAAPASQGFAGFDPVLIAQIVLLVGVFYFFMIRPQQKRAKQHQEMVNNIQRGDRVLTSGGIFGTVHKVESDVEVSIDIAENVRVRVLRSTLANVVSKNEIPSSGDTAAIKKQILT